MGRSLGERGLGPCTVPGQHLGLRVYASAEGVIQYFNTLRRICPLLVLGQCSENANILALNTSPCRFFVQYVRSLTVLLYAKSFLSSHAKEKHLERTRNVNVLHPWLWGFSPRKGMEKSREGREGIRHSSCMPFSSSPDQVSQLPAASRCC